MPGAEGPVRTCLHFSAGSRASNGPGAPPSGWSGRSQARARGGPSAQITCHLWSFDQSFDHETASCLKCPVYGVPRRHGLCMGPLALSPPACTLLFSTPAALTLLGNYMDCLPPVLGKRSHIAAKGRGFNNGRPCASATSQLSHAHAHEALERLPLQQVCEDHQYCCC